MGKYEIEIDCPDGYEPIAFRAAMDGDLYVDHFLPDRVREVTDHSRPCGNRLIVRKKWTPAPWMPKGAVLFRNAINRWVFAKNHRYYHADDLAELYGETFEPPPTSPVRL